MKAIRRINERNQITLPPGILRDAGAEPGALLEIETRDGKIILEPKRFADDALSDEDWERMDKLVRRQTKAGAYAEYANPLQARKHLRSPRR